MKKARYIYKIAFRHTDVSSLYAFNPVVLYLTNFSQTVQLLLQGAATNDDWLGNDIKPLLRTVGDKVVNLTILGYDHLKGVCNLDEMQIEQSTSRGSFLSA